jgi:hypothetical protein
LDREAETLRKRNLRRGAGLKTETLEKKYIQNEYMPLFPDKVRRIDSLERLVNKKQLAFINTSNLFTKLPQSFCKERQKFNPLGKVGTFAPLIEGRSSKGSKKSKSSKKGLFNSANCMDGSR